MSYFPMFIELKQQPCLVIGGGSVASRKAAVLEDFGARVAVIAPVISAEIKTSVYLVSLSKGYETCTMAGKNVHRRRFMPLQGMDGGMLRGMGIGGSRNG